MTQCLRPPRRCGPWLAPLTRPRLLFGRAAVLELADRAAEIAGEDFPIAFGRLGAVLALPRDLALLSGIAWQPGGSHGPHGAREKAHKGAYRFLRLIHGAELTGPS